MTSAIGSDRTGDGDSLLPLLALAMASIGMFAALIAAATKRLILPTYLDNLKDLSDARIESIKTHSALWGSY